MRAYLFSVLCAGTFLAACQSKTEPTDGGGGSAGSAGSTGSDSGPGASDADAVLDRGGCADTSGKGTQHDQAIDADETWRAEDSPHYVTADIQITKAHLTIEKCAVVVLSDGVRISVGGSSEDETGSLTAAGEVVDNTPDDDTDADFTYFPVLFTADADSHHWTTLETDIYGSLSLSVTALVNGGKPIEANASGAVLAWGKDDGTLTQNVKAELLVIHGAAGYGVNLQRGAGFTDDSLALIVSQSGNSDGAPSPVHVDARAIGSLPAPAELTGNVEDQIEVKSYGIYLSQSATLKNLGVPYVFDGDFTVKQLEWGTDPITLSIEPGVTLQFADQAQFIVGDAADDFSAPNLKQVDLVAEGTADEPITFTSAAATPEKRDWKGLYLRAVTPDTVTDHAVIEYAGAELSWRLNCGQEDGDNDAALVIANVPPTNAFVTNTTFRHNGSQYTIMSDWSADDGSGPDLVTGNTFIDTPGSDDYPGDPDYDSATQQFCKQSAWWYTGDTCWDCNPICFVPGQSFTYTTPRPSCP